MSPILITLLFGVIEYGLMFNQLLAIETATRDGARWSATLDYTIDDAPDAAVAHVRESLDLLDIRSTEEDEAAGACELVAERDPLLGYEAITVTTTIRYNAIAGGLLPTSESLQSRSSFVLADQSPPTS